MRAEPRTHVRRLRLRAQRRDQLPRAAALVEDALRIASGPAGTFLVVRRLELGRFSTRISPSSLALRVEQHLRRAALEAVHGASPSAAAAQAVYFVDRAEARALAAEVLLGGGRLEAWYWAQALAAGCSSAQPAAALEALLFDLPFERAERVEQVATWAHLARAGALAAALEHLTPGRATACLRNWSAPGEVDGDGETASGAQLGALPAPWRAALQRALERNGGCGPLPTFVGLLALAVRAPGRIEEQGLARAARALARAVVEFSKTRAQRGAAVHALAPKENAAAARPAAPGPGPWGSAEQTGVAGALFLVNALRRQRVEQGLAREPDLHEHASVRRMLCTAARCRRALPDDPLAALLDSLEVDPPDPLAARAQLARLARWIRRASAPATQGARGLSLLELVGRRGCFTASATHIDLWLPLETVDPRVRRAGLDLDPGWFAPLGRVLSFHFTPGGELR